MAEFFFKILLLAASFSLVFGIYYIIQKNPKLLNKKQSKNIVLIDSMFIDSQKQVILLRCNERNHLVLCGPNNSMVIDSFSEFKSTSQQTLSTVNSINEIASNIITTIKT